MTDIATLQAALLGYQAHHGEVIAKMDEIRKRFGKARSGGAIPPRFRAKRKLSAAARKRIAAAQRKRWAEFHAKSVRKAGGAKKTARTVSPEVGQNRIVALARVRAAKAQKK